MNNEANKYPNYTPEYSKYASKRNHHLANAGKYSTSFIKGNFRKFRDRDSKFARDISQKVFSCNGITFD